ncbi:carboxypeptidase-like protein [Hypnocyclicus thermotrophus]|uniref:Carboxypeptidase-like protein n=1 Tax=Hypnocyclicus thermotrophus TaxID=1627895 RepID=A0AA46DYK6_9FUSO|nr:carboxypeptidase-like regulatory domain-containing protein [Hypnocyclicus thermotrophus]TDT69772.1 carboxypeptidase-like protein [Hypnocyclicus thermotrophus]
MKKISSIILFFILTILVNAAEIKGFVKVENHEDYGVFVYVENELLYDISDQEGNFYIDNLTLGKEYTLVFQKGDLPDYKKKVKIEKNVNEVIVEIPDVRKDIRYPVVGRVNSKIDKDIFLDFNDDSYGIILKPNVQFKTSLLEGDYKAKLIQEGAYQNGISFKVEKDKVNNIGTYNMEPIDYNTLTLRFNDKIKDGVILLYKDDYLAYSKRIKNGTKNLTIEPLRSGVYTVKIKAYGKMDFVDNIEIKGSVIKDIPFENLSKFDNIYVNIYPQNIEAKVKIYNDGNIVEEVPTKGLVILEALDYKKEYEIRINAPKYKETIIKRAKVGDKLEVNLKRDVKGNLLKGYIYPFNSNATVMLLDKNKIIATTKADENGYYELETKEKVEGRKIIRVKANGFEEKTIIKTIDKSIENENFNIELEPKISRLSGTVSLNKKEKISNALVIIEELAIWQSTNNKGEYYFKNIPEGKYHIIFKKLGYESKREEITISKGEAVIKNVEIKPIGKMIFRSNIENYTLKINGKRYAIKTKLFERVEGLGLKNIIAEKPGYLSVRTQLKLTEAGEIRDVNIEFLSIEEQDKIVKEKIQKIRDYIANLELTKAEEVLYELSEVKQLKSYEKDYIDIKDELKKAKATLFGIDRNIKFEMENIKSNINISEKKDIGYLEKQRFLEKVYKQSIDRLEKIILTHPYTTYRYDILILQGDIYTKLGMVNSSKNSYEEAKKYINRRK